jgi:hypothetical protein
VSVCTHLLTACSVEVDLPLQAYYRRQRVNGRSTFGFYYLPFQRLVLAWCKLSQI